MEVAAFGPNYRPFLAQVFPPFTTRSRVPFEKLIVSPVVKKFPPFDEPTTFIAVPTKAGHLSLYWARSRYVTRHGKQWTLLRIKVASNSVASTSSIGRRHDAVHGRDTALCNVKIVIIIIRRRRRTCAKISRNNSRGKAHHTVESTSTNGQNYS